ncbi:MAG TPA: glycosyltransferase family 4 protein [Opitutaceae bacterium]|nr:glycosyltransferase family 4 protein [Opitutaceae bacterium]
MPAVTAGRVIFVNRHYWPSEAATAQLLTDLAEGLAGCGWTVTVLTSRGGPGAEPPEDDRHGVHVIRLRATRWGRRSLAGKACDYLTFSLACRRALPGRLAAHDRLVAMTDPPALAALVATAGRSADVAVVHWIQDIHPEITIALPGHPVLKRLSGPWIRRRDAAWKNARACVAISEEMAAVVAEHGVAADRIRVLPNWAPAGPSVATAAPAENALRREWRLTDQFVVAYSGNLGRVHALEPVLEAADRLRGEPGLMFLFAGDGPQRARLEQSAAARRLTNVRFLPAQPRARLAESLSAGDVHLITLRSGCERYVYPSKLYGVLAVGRPILFVGSPHGGLAAEVHRRGAGMVAADDSPDAIAAAVRTLRGNPERRADMGRAAADWHRATGGFSAALAKWEELLRDLR